jgi:hypothetical protein
VRRSLVTTMTVLMVLSVSGGAYVRHAPHSDELSQAVQRSLGQANSTTRKIMERVEVALGRAGRALPGR